MTEISRPWQSTSPGDAGPYSAGQWQQLYQSIIGLGAKRINIGVLLGSGTQPTDPLRVQAKGVPTTSIDVLAGSALVQGAAYMNSATVSFVIAANGSGNPRIDTVVLRADYALQTVRLAVLQGTPAASPVAPALTQSANVLWEIPLANIAVANGFATITNANITQRQEYANSADSVYLDSILNDSGGTLVTGDVVILDVGTDRAATTTTTVNDALTLGVWSGTTPNGGYGRVVRTGIAYVNCDAAITRGQSLGSTTTLKRANVASGHIGALLATALETTAGAGLCLCFVNVNTVLGYIPDVVLVQDQQTSGVAGTSLTLSGWRTRTLNTEVVDTGGIATLGSNQVTLQPGRYTVSAIATAVNASGSNRLRIQNITAGTTIAQGTNVIATSSVLISVVAEFDIAVASVIALQHWPTVTANAGVALSTGDVEVYASVLFTRLKDI